MEEIERLKFSINRFDGYYGTVNIKSNVLIAVNIFLVGGLISSYLKLQNIVDFDFWVIFNYMFIVIGGLASMLFAVSASMPYLSSATDSIFFFNSISNKGLEAFHSDSKEVKSEQVLLDLRNQVFYLSQGLNKKFHRLKTASILLICEIIAILPFILLLIKNTK